jgi:dienelactone hydrolase
MLPKANARTTYLAQSFQAPDGYLLKGHLAVPKAGKGPFPAVLLLVGSGPHNRYEDIPARMSPDGKPMLLFKQLEEALIAKGIAVFTYDKRGITPKDDSFLTDEVGDAYKRASTQNFVDDAVAAYDWLKKNIKEVDPRRTGVLGHSQGTTIAIKLAEKRPDVRSLFMLALYARSGTGMQYYQDVSVAMRLFYLLDKDQDGFVDEKEYAPFAKEAGWPFQDDQGTTLGWKEALVAFNAASEGKINEQRWRYKLESEERREIASRTPAKTRGEFLKEESYLERELVFCERLHLFHGEVDALSPFEDVLELQAACKAKGRALASFKSYPALGHCFSPRSGLRHWRDTRGPIEQTVLTDVATEVEKALKE